MLKKILIIIFLIVGAITAVVTSIKPVEIAGSAMAPNYLDKENYILNKVAYVFTDIKRGDVIVYEYPNKPNYEFISRIIGLPGETIRISNGNVYINDTILTETYLEEGITTETKPRQTLFEKAEHQGQLIDDTSQPPFISENESIIIPDSSYFVLSDNREKSFDSRSLGFISKEDIIGKIAFKYKMP